MSYNFDGKIANQCPFIINYTTPKTECSKCGKVIEAPHRSFIEINNRVYLTFNYLETTHYLYETKGGVAVAYCSDYCKRKHNHRFAK